MLWWVPPTSVTLVLRVEKSKSRHAHHALETTQLRSTCILGEKHPPLHAQLRVWSFMLPPWISPPVFLSQWIQENGKEKEKGGKQRRERESKVTYADRLKHSWQCVQLFLVRDAPWRSGGILLLCELSKVPRCGPADRRRAHGSVAARRKVERDSSGRESPLRSSVWPTSPAESREWRFGGGWGGETREIIKRCSALESTPTPPEWCDSRPLSLPPSPPFSHFLSSILPASEERLKRMLLLLLLNYAILLPLFLSLFLSLSLSISLSLSPSATLIRGYNS